MLDWGWDWTDCCTVKSNNLSQTTPGDMQPPRAPLAPPKKQRPYSDEKGAATRDPYNSAPLDGREKGENRNNYNTSPYSVSGSGYKPQFSATMSTSQQSQSPNGGFSSRSTSQVQPPRPTSQLGQYVNAPNAHNVGLGIAFQQKLNASDTPRPKLAVKSLAVGSPAFACGQIQVGDVLHSIGDIYVKGMSGSEIAPFILGPPGSEIRMAFERPMPDGSFRMVHVDLARTWTHVGTAPPAAQPVLLRQFGAV